MANGKKRSSGKNSNYKQQPAAQVKKQNRTMTVAVAVLAVIAIAAVIVLITLSAKSHSAGSTPELHHVEIEIRDYGTISLELDAGTAPITVANFLELAGSGFYDGLTFHRIMDGFMMQGGDPEGTGFGGGEKKIKGEFSANGVENNISHLRGVISMARSQNMNSASTQFFIVQSDSTFLDGNYAGFGHVTSGMEIVDEICRVTPVQDNNGTVLAKDQPVITAVRVID